MKARKRSPSLIKNRLKRIPLITSPSFCLSPSLVVRHSFGKHHPSLLPARLQSFHKRMAGTPSNKDPRIASLCGMRNHGLSCSGNDLDRGLSNVVNGQLEQSGPFQETTSKRVIRHEPHTRGDKIAFSDDTSHKRTLRNHVLGRMGRLLSSSMDAPAHRDHAVHHPGLKCRPGQFQETRSMILARWWRFKKVEKAVSPRAEGMLPNISDSVLLCLRAFYFLNLMLGFCGKSETNGMKASEGFYLLFRLVGEWDP